MAKDDTETEGAAKIPYPKSIIFIIGNEFCERFNYYGMRTVLSLYLKRVIGFSADISTFVFHTFMMMNYALCIIGAIICDNWLGKYYTILIFSLVYVLGSITITIGAVPPLHLPEKVFCLTGLFLITLGSGGIKPCVAAFGGDQFKLPEQNKQMSQFFFMFYFSINAGSLISTSLTPVLRANVHCFGDLTCYSLAFAVPGVLMLTAVAFFIGGRPWYIIKPAAGSTITLTVKAVSHALFRKCKATEKREHWLDHADDQYDKSFLDDIKAVFRIIILYVPLPFFWALFDQQGSRWIFQAAHMDGRIGDFRIKPDQMHVFNPLLIMVLIPIFRIAVYPALTYVGIRRPLQKMVMGGTLAGMSFLLSFVLELQLEDTYAIMPKAGNAQLRIFNGEACDYDITTNIAGQEKFVLNALDLYTYRDIDVPDGKFELTYTVTSADTACPTFTTKPLSILEKTAYSIFLNSKNTANPIRAFEDNVEKPEKGLPYGRVLANIDGDHNIIWKDEFGEANEDKGDDNTGIIEFAIGPHKIFLDDKELLEIKLLLGGSYTIIISEKADKSYLTKVHLINDANSIHILWQLPQIVLITIAEVMFSITGLEFSYAQAPISMKSVVLALWLTTTAIGNLLVMFAAKFRFLKQSYEFLLFAVLMLVDMAIFALMAYVYKSHDPTEPNKTK